MNRYSLPLGVLLLTLALSLTACGTQIGIIGGADGPTSIFVADDESKSIVIGPDGEVTTPDAADPSATDAASPDAMSGADAASPDATGADTAIPSGASSAPDAQTPDAADASGQESNGPDGIPPAPEEPPVPLTLALLSGPWAEAVKAELAAFEQGNHAVCSVRELSRDDLHDILTQGAPDVDLVMVHSSNMPEFRKSGVLANLSALGYKPDSDFIPSVTEICTDGHTFSLAPWYGNASVLLCNKNALLAANSSVDRIQSLENMLSVCQAAKKRGEIGFAYHENFEDRITLDFLPVLRSFDGWFLDHNGKPSVYTKKFQDAVNAFLELAATGKSLSNAELISAVDDGRAAMGFIRTDWYAPSAKSAATYLAFPGAAVRGGETHSAGTCAIWGLGIPAASRQPELAERLLEYLINPNIQRSMLPSGVTPCRYSILQDPALQKDYPCYGKVLSALESSQYVPALTQWPQMCDILGEELWKVMAGRKLVTECLADAQSRMEALLAS